MPGLIAFIGAAVALVATGAGTFSAASFAYGAFYWVGGDHERGKKHITGSLIGIAILLTAVVLGTSIGGLPHG
jgi:hypothetical protein